MNTIILHTFLLILLPGVSLAQDDFDSLAKTVEARFGCREGTVLAEEINSLRDMGANTFLCQNYRFVVRDLVRAQGNVEAAISASGFLDSQLPATDQTIESRESECSGLTRIVRPSGRGFFRLGIWTEPGEGTYSACPGTIYQCAISGSVLDDVRERDYPEASITPAITRLIDLQSIVVDHNCLREVYNDVANTREAFNQQTSISATCREQTSSLKVNAELRQAFSDVDVIARTRVVDEVATDFVEYQNNSSSYANICRSNGGTFAELDLRAVCRGWTTRSFEGQVLEVELVVTGRPRCYGIDCTLSDDVGLFEELTLRETERMWERDMPNTFWACQGQLVADDNFSVCREETTTIGESAVLRSTNAAIVPDVEQRRGAFLFFWTVDIDGEKLATFLNSSGVTMPYEEACVENGGTFSVADDFVLECEQRRRGGGSRVQERLEFAVSGFPVCLSPACNGSSDSDGAEATLIVEKLEQVDALSRTDDFEWFCVHTSGTFSLMSPGVLSLMTSLFAAAWFV